MILEIRKAPSNKELVFLDIADRISQQSKDTTKIGAVLVQEDRIISSGYNGLPRGANDDDPSRKERPKKYLYTVHAELNAVLNAAAHGAPTKGATLYLTVPPNNICSSCVGALLQAGITDFRGWGNRGTPIVGDWMPAFEAAEELAYELNVTRTYYV